MNSYQSPKKSVLHFHLKCDFILTIKTQERESSVLDLQTAGNPVTPRWRLTGKRCWQSTKCGETNQPIFPVYEFNNFLPSLQSFAPCYWPVSCESSKNENQIWPSCLWHCSYTNLEPITSFH